MNIYYGKEENEEVEIEYKDLQVKDYQVSSVNDDILIRITKELHPDYIYHFLVTAALLDGTEEEFHIQFEAKGNNN